MDVLLVVDMQQGLLRGAPKHDLAGVVERIDRLAARVRQRWGRVVFVQHDGPPGDDFAPYTPGWPLLDAIARDPGDRIVRKTSTTHSSERRDLAWVAGSGDTRIAAKRPWWNAARRPS